MLQRVVRAVTFDVKFFNEVKSDISLNQEALIVVAVSSLLAAIGSITGGIGYALLLVIWGVLGYYIWSYVTWLVGKNFFGGSGDVGELQRTLGYAWAPRALGLLGIVPCVGWVFGLVGALWSLGVGILAVREGMQVDTGKAIATTFVGWVIVLVITGLLGLIFGLGFMGARF